MPENPTAFLPLTTDVLMILLAVERHPGHGYAIMKEVERTTSGSIRLQTGALYRALKRLLMDGLLDECAPPDNEQTEDERRRYYRTTKLGSAVVEAEIERKASLVRVARATRSSAASRRTRLA